MSRSRLLHLWRKVLRRHIKPNVLHPFFLYADAIHPAAHMGGVFAFFAHDLTFSAHFGKIELSFDGASAALDEQLAFGFQL